MWIAIVFAVGAACAAGGLAWGYRGQRDQERGHNGYLRAQLAIARGEPIPAPLAPPPSSTRALQAVRAGQGVS